MRIRLFGSSIAFLALVFPIAALADFSNTQTITSGQHLTLDNGATSTSGGDLAFTGTSITPQGSAKLVDYSMGSAGSTASTLYGLFTSSADLSYLTYTATPISGSSLVANEIFLALDNAGNYAKVWITAVSSTSLTIQYDTFGAPAGGNTPTISAVLDAGSYTPNIAQGETFVVKGNNLSASGPTQFTSFPLPITFEGVQIFFTPQNGGNVTPAYIVYLYNQGGVNQLAAVLPSTVPVGFYNVTVINNGPTSPPFSVQVVKQKPGLITVDSSGYGLVLVQNYTSASAFDLDRYTTGTLGGYAISPAYPGQTEVAYLVGSGPDPGPDNEASPGYPFLTNGVSAQVIVGGTTITPSYLGRVGGATGYEQVNFVLPANVQTGCVVSFQVVENGIASPVTYISIAPVGASACAQAGYTTTQLQNFENGTTYLSGGFSILKETGSAEGETVSYSEVAGEFTEYNGFELAGIPANIGSSVPPSGCTVTQYTPTTPATYIPSYAMFLDAGKLTLTGPSGSGLNSTQLPETLNTYDLAISGEGSTVNGNIVAGTYTLTGAGGTGVGQFTATVTLPTLLTITGGLPTTVTRSAGQTINWTGGNSSDLVIVSGGAESLNSNGSEVSGASFVCYTTAGTGGITVPSSILTQLPAISAAQISAGSGGTSLSVGSGSSSTFSAPLAAGGTITNATFGGNSSIGAEPAYQ
jgi:uncharacterized protein (TIGR03437 family)